MKNVNFDKTQYVIYIPSRTDLIRYKLVNDLWWSEHDYEEIQQSAQRDIKRLMRIHKSMTIQNARKLLYQPGNIRYDENNFD